MLEQLRSAIGVLERVASGLEPGCLSGRDAAAALDDVARGERLRGAIKALLARRVDETRAWRADGHKSAAHWLADVSGVTVGAACRSLDTARALDALPATEKAFRAGQLSEVQAAEITGAAREDAGAQDDLLAAAATTSVKGLRDRCRQVRAGAQADDEAWARRLHETRRVQRWSDVDGAYRADVRLAPEAGARFDSALEAHLDRIFTQARREGRREPRVAYAADALVALATEGPVKPAECRVVIDHGALRRGHTEAGERCEIAGIGAVPVATARALLDDASITLVARDGDDVTAVSSPTRTIPAKLRRALETRYPVCAVSTCANERGLQIDHVVELAEGGRTELENLWRACVPTIML